jgi:acetyl-CoA decarbonylase/synthase complex subunit gamma
MFVKKSGIIDKVKHTELIIPGSLAIAGDVEEEFPAGPPSAPGRRHLAGFKRQ